MESKILNFPDAMRVAQIITKYIPDTESIKVMEGEEFYSELFSQMDVTEITQLFSLLLQGDMGSYTSPEIATKCLDGMIKNNILDLLDTYTNLGLTR